MLLFLLEMAGLSGESLVSGHARPIRNSDNTSTFKVKAGIGLLANFSGKVEAGLPFKMRQTPKGHGAAIGRRYAEATATIGEGGCSLI